MIIDTVYLNALVGTLGVYHIIST